MPLETMLRVYFLQNWYGLSDTLTEETIYAIVAMHWFAGIELGDDRIPNRGSVLCGRLRLCKGQDQEHT